MGERGVAQVQVQGHVHRRTGCTGCGDLLLAVRDSLEHVAERKDRPSCTPCTARARPAPERVSARACKGWALTAPYQSGRARRSASAPWTRPAGGRAAATRGPRRPVRSSTEQHHAGSGARAKTRLSRAARYLNRPVQQEHGKAALDVAEARVLADLQDAHDEVPPEAHAPQHDEAGDDELR